MLPYRQPQFLYGGLLLKEIKRVETVFLAMSLVFLCYLVSAFISEPKCCEVAAGFIKPSFQFDGAYLFTLVALIGTTITPFMQVYVQSSVVEKRLDKDDLSLVRADVIIGTIFATLIAIFIVISPAATLHANGITEIDSAATAAEALVPVVGTYAKYLFAIGLFGASMLAMGVLPLATAYSMSEALGFEKAFRVFAKLRYFSASSLFDNYRSIVALIPDTAHTTADITQCINGLLCR